MKLRKPDEECFEIRHFFARLPFPGGDGVGLFWAIDWKGCTGYFVNRVAFVSFSLGNLENPDPFSFAAHFTTKEKKRREKNIV